MSSGGDAPPPQPNGGEFLLQLLRKPSQQSNLQNNQQSVVSHDPAIAAVGPTYPPFYHNNNNLQLPFNYFHPNPVNNPGSNLVFGTLPQIVSQDLLFSQNTAQDSVYRVPRVNLAPGSVENRLSNQFAAQDSIFKGPVVNSGRGSVENRQRYQIAGTDSVFSGPRVNAGRGSVENRQNGISRIPPGFTGKVGEGSIGNGDSGNGRRVVDHNVGKGKVVIANNRVESGDVIKGMLDLRVSDSVVDKGIEVVKNDCDVDNLMGFVPPPKDESIEKKEEDLGVEGESGEQSDKKKNHRDRDYRCDNRGKWIMNQRMRDQKSHTAFRGDLNRLTAPFLALFESLIPPDEEKLKQKQLLTVLENLVHKAWPEARLYLYGSCGNSFGFSKSDIDLCLVMELGYIEKSDVLLKLADIFLRENLENVQALTRARVPIVKLMDPVTGISCDMCINNVLAVVNTKLLRDYAKIDSRLRQLVFIVKHWAKSRGVNETYHGTLSSYAYVLMCIHFLQQRRPAILPCLQGMEITYYKIVDGVECAYFDQVDKLHNFGSQNRESIAQLVWGFFHYWAYCHDYANDVISVRTGQTISKRAKDWTKRVGNDRHLICIEDPFELSHDLGRVVDKFSIRVLREEFERAAHIMQYDHNPCVTLFEPYTG